MTARKRAQRIRDHFAYESASEDEAHFQLAEREILDAERAAAREAVEAFAAEAFSGTRFHEAITAIAEVWLREREEQGRGGA